MEEEEEEKKKEEEEEEPPKKQCQVHVQCAGLAIGVCMELY